MGLRVFDIMASKPDKTKKKRTGSEWSKTGSFMNKPDRGWIHPDVQLHVDSGICYGVRYIGCLEVKESMRSLDFDTRTSLAREAISRVCESAGMKPLSKKKKDKKLSKMLGERPEMQYAGSNVNLTITTEALTLMIMESGEMIANHQMPGISFASGGDSETLDFVAYVAKDAVNGRACHVLECGGGLAEDVITTIGQAFELRFKEYLKNQPKPVTAPDRMENPISEGDAWGEDHEGDYYNDRPGARPPLTQASEYAVPTSNLPVSDGMYSSVKDPPLYDEAKEHSLIDFSDAEVAEIYDNKGNVNGAYKFDTDNVYDNKENVISSPEKNGAADPFDMEPFNAGLPSDQETFRRHPDVPLSPPDVPPQSTSNIAPVFEDWYHGALPRKQAEKLLQKDGDFLVRQSSSDPGQFVLCGKQDGSIKHLLLVDPDGVVRTKDRAFDSVPHLIQHHRTHSLPIISQESELHLLRPISNAYTNC
ncbi:SHC-transforming protein 1-like isoform X1 [Pecten maximus]|uniref:SHC-transforming protein 1-like isoform X1 n=2 Tax=Pecten maximus TaxID=6579 RepID=UPI00145868D0|nr:SHC-transforming protein 1-like isoform X1 [Pecten maximus]